MSAIHTRIFDGTDEDPKSKMRRYVIMLVALVVILVGGGFWAYFSFLHVPEEKAAERFFRALEAGDTQQAYQLWHADAAHYSYKDFLDDWGSTGSIRPHKELSFGGCHFAASRRQRGRGYRGSQSLRAISRE